MQLQATAIAGEVTQRTNAEIGEAQAELENPAPPQPQATQPPEDEEDREVAWFSTISPAAATHADASDDANGNVEEALEDAAGEHARDDTQTDATTSSPSVDSTSVPAPIVDTTVTAVTHPPVAATGIMGLLPSITFPWGVNSCVETSAQRAARMKANRLANA